jgi:hypothetical protein
METPNLPRLSTCVRGHSIFSTRAKYQNRFCKTPLVVIIKVMEPHFNFKYLSLPVFSILLYGRGIAQFLGLGIINKRVMRSSTISNSQQILRPAPKDDPIHYAHARDFIPFPSHSKADVVSQRCHSGMEMLVFVISHSPGFLVPHISLMFEITIIRAGRDNIR